MVSDSAAPGPGPSFSDLASGLKLLLFFYPEAKLEKLCPGVRKATLEDKLPVPPGIHWVPSRINEKQNLHLGAFL